MRSRTWLVLASLLVLAGLFTACKDRKPARQGKKIIVATYSVLGAAVKDLAGDSFEVRVLIPNGRDLHSWEPSPKDIEALNQADLIVQNGLGLEHGIEKVIDRAVQSGCKLFTVSDHIPVRIMGAGEIAEHREEGEDHDHDHGAGTQDPHSWTDPLVMKTGLEALARQLSKDFGVDLAQRSAELGKRLEALDAEIRSGVAVLPESRRKLVTGHESLGYFAQRYGFKLIGAVVPSLTSQAESSAADLGELKRLIRENGVPVVFTEVGTSPRTVEVLAREVNAKVIVLATHMVPEDGSYFSFERTLANEIIKGLK